LTLTDLTALFGIIFELAGAVPDYLGYFGSS